MGASVGAGANVGSCGPVDASDVVGGSDVCSPADASDDAADCSSKAWLLRGLSLPGTKAPGANPPPQALHCSGSRATWLYGIVCATWNAVQCFALLSVSKAACCVAACWYGVAKRPE